MLGLSFGRLTVIKEDGKHVYPSGRTDLRYVCRCSCGRETSVLGVHLRSGHTRSCGCLRKETTRSSFKKHGGYNTRLYRIWKNMKSRCYNKNNPDYRLYGGRGITICKEWLEDFANFRDWSDHNGYGNGLSIDRINNDLSYTPSNCRWASQKDQCNNNSRNVIIEHKGRMLSISGWSKETGIKYGTISSRIRRGWDPSMAVSEHPGTHKRSREKKKL